VGNEMNRLLHDFLDKNPSFNGKISVIGHSLGSLVLFDLLMHQTCDLGGPENKKLENVSLPNINFPKLDFKLANFFALGSPIPMFLTLRGINNLGTEFKLPTCDQFFNIFHPVKFA
jgi:hypothetical protein